MLGIPTRSDAAAVAQDYAEAVENEMMNERLRRFNSVFSTVFPHNHVAEAFRDTGNINRFMNHSSRFWDINPRDIPRGVEKLLKPELVRNHFLNLIAGFRSTLEETRAQFDFEAEVVVQSPDHKPYDGLFDIVQYEECDADYVIVNGGPFIDFVYSPGNGKGWKYTFNPYELAKVLLRNFERAVGELYQIEPTKFEKIASIARVADALGHSPNLRLAEGSMRLEGDQPYSLEHRPEHPARELSTRNEAIGKRSDMYLRFDEMYFVCPHPRGQVQIPASGLLDPLNRMKSYGLSHRIALRDIISSVLDEQGRVTINGTVYERSVLMEGGQRIDGYLADSDSCLEMTNLLGAPVQQPNGELLRPEVWAAEEVRLVMASRCGDRKAKEAMLARYDFDTTYGNPTKQKAIKSLEYCLSPSRF